jgi:hypothetical protein
MGIMLCMRAPGPGSRIPCHASKLGLAHLVGECENAPDDGRVCAGRSVSRAPLLASQEENEWPREDHTNPFAQPERTGIVRVHQKSQDQPGAKVRRNTAPDRRAQAVRSAVATSRESQH